MDIVPGQIANVDSEGRLVVPVDVLRVLEWWTASSVEVIAEVIQPQVIRIYLAREARPLIDLLLTEIMERPHSRAEASAIVADRYRPLKFYADGRLRFTKELCPLLGFQLGEQTTLFVQPFVQCLEIVTLQFRGERLARTISTTSIQVASRE